MTSPAVHPVDEKLPTGRLAALGLQHVLVMYAGAIAVPLIVGRALKLTPEQVALLISADLFCCGLVTLVQSLGLTPTTHAVVVSTGADTTDFGGGMAIGSDGDDVSGFWELADTVPAKELWELKRQLREKLVLDARVRLARSSAKRGFSAAEVSWIDTALDPVLANIGAVDGDEVAQLLPDAAREGIGGGCCGFAARARAVGAPRHRCRRRAARRERRRSPRRPP